MDEREARAAGRAIHSGWITQGPEVAAFEREFAAAVGAPHACAVSSCTAALHVALAALGVGAGDEVVTVSHSFIASANAVRYTGATPVFVDVEGDGHNIDPALVEGAIGPRTRAILAVHQLGMPCAMAAILRVADAHGLPVVEDAACAAGSEIRLDAGWERVGRPHGRVACFSFHPRKVLSTGDGGMLTTADDALDARFRLLRQHGMSVSDLARHDAATVTIPEYVTLGFNYRLTDIQAAIGREQLARLDEIVARRRALAARYGERLRVVRGVTPPREPEWARSNWQTYAVRLGEGLDQRAVMQRLLDAGVSSRAAVMNAHEEPAYPAGSWRAAPGGLARSERAARHGVALPLYHAMTEDEQDAVVEALARAVEAA